MTATISLDEIPGPRGLPVLGNVRDLDADAPFESLMRLADKLYRRNPAEWRKSGKASAAKTSRRSSTLLEIAAARCRASRARTR